MVPLLRGDLDPPLGWWSFENDQRRGTKTPPLGGGLQDDPNGCIPPKIRRSWLLLGYSTVRIYMCFAICALRSRGAISQREVVCSLIIYERGLARALVGQRHLARTSSGGKNCDQSCRARHLASRQLLARRDSGSECCPASASSSSRKCRVQARHFSWRRAARPTIALLGKQPQ